MKATVIMEEVAVEYQANKWQTCEWCSLSVHLPSKLISGSAFFAVLSVCLAPSGVESLYLSAVKLRRKYDHH